MTRVGRSARNVSARVELAMATTLLFAFATLNPSIRLVLAAASH